MWIRSQNKGRLLNANHVYALEKEIKGCNEECMVYNEMVRMEDSTYILGRYKDNKRAKEILDYIQGAICKGEKIYTMPKE